MPRQQSHQLTLVNPISQTWGDWWGSNVNHHPLHCCLAFAHPPESKTHLLPSPVPLLGNRSRLSTELTHGKMFFDISNETSVCKTSCCDGCLRSIGGAMATCDLYYSYFNHLFCFTRVCGYNSHPQSRPWGAASAMLLPTICPL